MSEAGRVSVALEVTGLEQLSSEMGKADAVGAKTAASIGRSMAALEKQMAAIDAIVTKATSGIVAAIDRQSASMTKGFSGIDAAMRRMQTGTAAAAASVSADAGKAGASLTQLDAIADRVAAGVTAALAGIAPAAASAATGTQQATTAMAGFDAAAQTIVAASARMEAALQEATGATRALSDSFAKAPKSDPFKPQSDGAENLRAKFNPLFAIGETYRTQVAAIRQANADGAIGFHEMEMAIQRAGAVADAQQRQYVKMDAALGATGDTARLTSNQMLNLSRQGNDVITMFAMGAPPMQIFASQAGQIYGALEEGPRGLRGSLEAIKGAVMGFAAGLGPAGIALGALGAAAVTFGIATRRNVEPIEDVIKAQADSVRQLRDAYGLAGDAAEDYARRSVLSLRLDAREGNRTSIDRARAGFRDQFTSQYAGSFNRLNEMRFAGAAELRAAFDELNRSIEAGTPRFIEFREELASIPDTDLPYFIKEAIQANREWANTFVPLQQQIEGAEAALDGTAQAAKRYKDAMSDLVSLTPDLRTNAERINEAFEIARSSSADGDEEMTAILQRQKAMAADTAGALEIYTQARADLAAVGLGDDARAIAQINAEYDRLEDQYLGNADALEALVNARKAAIDAVGAESALAEKARRDNYELDLRAVNARTAAEKASIESERVRIDLMAQGYTATEAAARATEAYTLAIAQSSAEWAKAAESRQFAREDALASAQAQVDSFGMTTGAAQAYGQAIQQLTAYRRAAAEAGMPIDPAEEQAIRDAASAAGAYTDALARMNMERDQAAQMDLLRGEAQLVGLTENARTVAMAGLEAEAELRRQNISLTDAWGQSYVQNARLMAGARVEIDRQTNALEKQREAINNVASTFLDIFTDNSSDSFFDRILSGLADVSRQFGELGKQRLMENLFGSTALYTSGFPAPGQRTVAPVGVPLAANQNVPAGGALNIGAVQALNTNLQRSSRSALDVARQFDGLNERADSAVLDSFMQASGNWRNLSARDTAWCAAFANAAIMTAGGQGTNSNRASSFADWGLGTNNPKPGDIVLLKPQARGASGHVGFFDGYDDRGGVRVFGGNQSNAANTRTFGADQVRAFRTATRDGYVDAVRHISSGRSDSISLAPSMSGAASQAMAGGWGGFGPVGGGNAQLGMMGRVGQFMRSPMGQMGLMGISSFAGGMQSGSAVGGGFSGALSGFAMGGPIGAAVGGLAGLVGGLFGRRRRRREEERQRAAQAAAAWDQASPQFEAMRSNWRTGDTLSGGFRDAFAESETQFLQLQKVASEAWRNRPGLPAQFTQAFLERHDYNERSLQGFRDSFSPAISSLNAGQGLEAPFITARNEVMETGKAMLRFVDDTRMAFGDGADQVGVAASAAAEQLRAMVSGSTEMSEIAASVEALRGGATQLGSELIRLGASFDDATRAVDETVGVVMDRMRRDFVQGLEDSLHELTGAGHIVDFRQSIAGFDTMFADAAILGVDAARVHEVYTRQMQAMVNQAELTGGQFEHLLTVFPQLRGVVTEFSSALVRSQEEIAAVIRGYDDRVFEVANDNSTRDGALARFDRLAERERQELALAKASADEILALERALGAERAKIVRDFWTDTLGAAAQAGLEEARDRLDRSYGAEVDRINEVIRARRDEITELERTKSAAESFNLSMRSLLDDLIADAALSPLDASDRLAETERQYRDTLAKAMAGDETARGDLASDSQRYLEEARSFWASSEQYGAIFQSVRKSLEGAETAAGREISEAQRQIERLERLIKGDESQLTALEMQYNALLKIDTSVIALGEAMRQFEAARRAQESVTGPSGLSREQRYLANNSDVLSSISAGQTFGLAPGSSLEAIVRAHFEQFGRSEGRRFASGGLVSGPGTGTSDSIKAMLSNGEYVVPAARVPANLPALEAMRVGRPVIADSGNGLMAGEIRALREENSRLLRILISTTGGGLADVKNSSDRNARAAEQASLAERRRTNNRQAA